MDTTVVLGVVFVCIALAAIILLAYVIGGKPRERRIEVEDWKVRPVTVWPPEDYEDDYDYEPWDLADLHGELKKVRIERTMRALHAIRRARKWIYDV